MIYGSDEMTSHETINIETPVSKREQFVLSDDEITSIAKWAMLIEDHYQKPMDIEWAKDGVTCRERAETFEMALNQVIENLVKQLRSEREGRAEIW